MTGASSAMRPMRIGTGTLFQTVSRHPDEANPVPSVRPYGSTAPVGAMPGPGTGAGAGRVSTPLALSDLLDDMLAEQPRGFDEQDGDQQHERDRVAVLRAALDVPDDHHFDQSDDHSAGDGAGDVADPAEDRRDERFDARQEPHERLDGRVFHRVQHP